MDTLTPEKDNLSADLGALMNAARARAVAENRVDRTGAVRRSVESVAFHNRLQDWHDAGKPADQLAALKAEEKRLRKAGLF